MVQSIDNLSTPQLIARFAEARARDYQELIGELHKVSSAASRKSSPGRTNRLRTPFREIGEVDFFHSPLQKRVEELFARVKASPSSNGETAKVNPREYLGR